MRSPASILAGRAGQGQTAAMRIDTDDYVTCTHAAELAGCSRQYMRRLALDGRVRSVVIDGLLFVHRADALKLSRDNGR